ncbi:MAG: HNH endonuclease [Bryobacteraceae bacterium]|jgi:5-methylcytosine-specific restriction protein A
MPTYLFSWNPLTAFKWPNNGVNSAATRRGKVVHIRWSTGGTTCIVPGDRIFLGKVRQHPTGVIASGVAVSDCFEDTHWEDSSKRTTYNMVDFDTILDPESVLPRSRLSEGSLGDVNWDTEYGGVTIGEEAARALEAEWRDWLGRAGFPQIERELEQSTFQLFGYAGWIKLRLHLLLERDSRLLTAKRSEALRRQPGGLECEACMRTFDDAGSDLIEAHDIELHDRRPLSTLDSTGDLETTIEDLALVCANCHRMLHSQDWPSVEELRSQLVKQKA